MGNHSLTWYLAVRTFTLFSVFLFLSVYDEERRANRIVLPNISISESHAVCALSRPLTLYTVIDVSK